MKTKAFHIIFEDDHLMAVDKRAGVLTIPDRYNDDKVNLYALLIHYRDEIYPLHRIDKDTSGLLVYAKDAHSHAIISEQFEKREVYKEYFALVNGILSPEKGTIETFLAKSERQKNKIVITTKKGKKAITHYEVIETFKDYSWLKVVIDTGRQHQIRVHLSHIGHPLAVDYKYGNKKELFAYEIKKKKFNFHQDRPPKPLISRHTLHAAKLKIIHPRTGERMTFEAPLPKDLRATLNQLRKWNAV